MSMWLMAMDGLWNVSPPENTRIVTEKMHAMIQSATKASRVSLRGGSPAQITAAAIAPLRRATGTNSKRLKKNDMTSL